jgi:hypothetical protein
VTCAACAQLPLQSRAGRSEEQGHDLTQAALFLKYKCSFCLHIFALVTAQLRTQAFRSTVLLTLALEAMNRWSCQSKALAQLTRNFARAKLVTTHSGLCVLTSSG